MGVRGEKETTATCSRKMSVRANRSVASSILEFRLFQSGFFLVLEGNKQKEDRRGEHTEDGPRGRQNWARTGLKMRIFSHIGLAPFFWGFFLVGLGGSTGQTRVKHSLSLKGKEQNNKKKRLVFSAFAKANPHFRHRSKNHKKFVVKVDVVFIDFLCFLLLWLGGGCVFVCRWDPARISICVCVASQWGK